MKVDSLPLMDSRPRGIWRGIDRGGRAHGLSGLSRRQGFELGEDVGMVGVQETDWPRSLRTK